MLTHESRQAAPWLICNVGQIPVVPPRVPSASEKKPKSAVGIFCCSVLAVALYPVLFVLGWATFSPIYEKKDFVGLFVALRDGSYNLFSGRVFKAMILHYPNPDPDSKE